MFVLRVLRCKVKANGKIYEAGQNLPQLSADDENRLLESGIAEEIRVEPTEIEPEKPAKKTKKHVEDEQDTKDQEDVAVKENADDMNSEENEVDVTPEDDAEGVNIDLNLDDVVVEGNKDKKKSGK
jgi:hypothetical protein